MSPQRLRHGPVEERLDNSPAVGLVVVLQAEESQHRGSNVGVVGPTGVVGILIHPGPTIPTQVEAISS